MDSLNCHQIREGLATFVGEALDVISLREGCVISLPWLTPDRRFVEVWVEPQDQLLLVHDAGKSLSQLYVQGIHPTPGRNRYFLALAARYGVDYEDHTFRATTRWDRLPQTIVNIAQCATLAMRAVVTHEPSVGRTAVARGAGLEPATSRLVGGYSLQLSYPRASFYSSLSFPNPVGGADVMNGYDIAWNGTLEREAIRQQQRPPEPKPLVLRQQQRVRARLWPVLSSRKRYWWSVSEIQLALGGDVDRTWVSNLLRQWWVAGQVERRAETNRRGRLWRYRVKG